MKKIINVLLKKEKPRVPPVWFMRQAGRYLPEYREIRKKADNFLDLCYNPKLACEITLQPIRRFDLDAAIIFSDILVIPDALGMDVSFLKGEGPKIKPLTINSDLKKLRINDLENKLAPVFETLQLTKSNLPKNKALIGFSGSPWTLACYMIEGGSSKNFNNVRRFAIEHEAFFSDLMEILSQSIISYLLNQIKYGADVVKLFDSWAGVLTPQELIKWVINPTKKIVSEVRKYHPEIPIICFPRGIGVSYEEFVKNVDCYAVALDQNLPKNWACENLQKNLGSVIQGNLDNFLLAFGSKEEIEREVLEILSVFDDYPFIFNLGHGVLPETPIENIELVLKLIRQR